MSLLSNKRISYTIIAALLGMFLCVRINLNSDNARSLIETLNSSISIFLAGSATTLSWYYWSRLSKADPIKKVWLFLTIGLGLWTTAEIIWLVLTLSSDEVPYPSIADGLWIIGYIFIFLPFLFLYRLLQITPPKEKILAFVISAIAYTFIVLVYVISPIIQSAESLWLEKALASIYLIGDLLVTFGALILAMALVGGAFSWVWTFISIGFLFQTFSDTLFTYGDWNSLYLSNGSLNFLTTLVDMTYIFGYVLIALGIYIQIEFSNQNIKEPLIDHYHLLLEDSDISLTPVRITLFTNSEDTIISTSPSVIYLQSSENGSKDMNEMPFHQALGMEFKPAQLLLQKMRDLEELSAHSITVVLFNNEIARAKISGVSKFNLAGIYIGSDVIISLRLKDEFLIKEIGAGIDVEHASGSEDRRIEDKLITLFFIEKMRTLYIIAYRFGGIHATKSLERIFNSNSNRMNASLFMDGPAITSESNIPNLTAYRELLGNSINYIIALTSLEIVTREIEKVESRLDRETVRAGKKAGIHGLNFE